MKLFDWYDYSAKSRINQRISSWQSKSRLLKIQARGVAVLEFYVCKLIFLNFRAMCAFSLELAIFLLFAHRFL